MYKDISKTLLKANENIMNAVYCGEKAQSAKNWLVFMSS